jgi:hypothetical protein
MAVAASMLRVASGEKTRARRRIIGPRTPALVRKVSGCSDLVPAGKQLYPIWCMADFFISELMVYAFMFTAPTPMRLDRLPALPPD